MTAGLIKSTRPLHFRTTAKNDPFRVGFGTAGHRHPRRDDEEGGHEGEGGKKETAEEKAAREKAEAEKKPAKSAEQRAAEKAAKDAVTAKDAAEKELQELRDKHATEDEKKINASVTEKLKAAVDAKEIELTDAFTSQIAELQDEIIDSTIDRAFDAAGRTREQFKTVLATLDRRTFVGDDGKVKRDEVTKWASELAGSSSARPPRTSGVASGGRDRGFGHLIAQKN